MTLEGDYNYAVSFLLIIIIIIIIIISFIVIGIILLFYLLEIGCSFCLFRLQI
jgi:hypothetical protein